MSRIPLRLAARRRRDATHASGRCTRGVVLFVALAVSLSFFASAAWAQHDGPVGQAPAPAPGPGALTVAIVSDEADLDLGGLPLALYALSPDGTPGLANAETDAQGQHVFSDLANDPSIVYLVGVQHQGIPFGERITFAAGETAARIEVRVSTPTAQVSGVRIDEARLRIDWMGDRLLVTEILRFTSAGPRVIRLSPDAAGKALFSRTLPTGATDFNTGPTSIGDELRLEGDRVRFYGPLYPGDQRVEYQWSWPLDREATDAAISFQVDDPVARVITIAGTAGLEIEGPELVPSRALTDDDQSRLSSWTRGGLAAEETLPLRFSLPENRRDPIAVRLPRADVRLDLDDTRLEANVDLQLLVSPGAPVSGTADAPLLQVRLPAGASLEGVAEDAQSMGLVPTSDGGFDVIGPIGPGEHALRYAYRMPSQPSGVEIGMRFPRAVETLNVLVADNQVALDSRRLHRRRPFRDRTRNYLHRQAYNVSMTETVDLRLEPLRASGLAPTTARALVGIGAVVAVLFLVAPLRKSARKQRTADPELLRLREEREGVYSDIADLEHDFETGKLDEADYESMRATLRARAIATLREEQALDPDAAVAAPDSVGADSPEGAETAPPSNPSAETGPFCPSCGERVDPRWRFCSHCGGPLEPVADPGDGASA